MLLRSFVSLSLSFFVVTQHTNTHTHTHAQSHTHSLTHTHTDPSVPPPVDPFPSPDNSSVLLKERVGQGYLCKSPQVCPSVCLSACEWKVGSGAIEEGNLPSGCLWR